MDPGLHLFVFMLLPLAAIAQEGSGAAIRSEFHIQYVNGSNVYIDGGRAAGLSEGMALVVRQSERKPPTDPANSAIRPGIIAELKIVAVASSSAVCEVRSSGRALVEGDVVALAETEVRQRQETQELGSTRAYPMIVSFTEGDPLDEEVREELPRPPLPEVNEARGRLGFDVSTIRSLGGSSSVFTEYGFVARTEITRIAGSHWNLNGYYRGQMRNASTPTRSTIQDLINRTYVMELTYQNPDSAWTFGAGRLYLPWATSLEVIDGAYVGRKIGSGTVAGLFGGSTPDPAAWNYDPNRRIGGGFFNAHGGGYDGFRYSSTIGAGIDLAKWTPQRPFLFTENDFSWRRILSVYHSMQIDKPTANPSTPAVPPGLGQSFLSAQVRVVPRVTLQVNHTYLRDVPTYDAALVGTGLLDPYLFQGATGGARVELPLRLVAYFSAGQSNTSTDKGKSWNLQGGATLLRVPKIGLQLDARYSDFSSQFASGTYKTLTVSRPLAERLLLNLQTGRQQFASSLTTNTGSWFGNAYCDANLGTRYFTEMGYTTQRGGTDDYNQWTFAFGYRFDNRAGMRRAGRAH